MATTTPPPNPYRFLTLLDQYNTIRQRALDAERQHFDASWQVESIQAALDAQVDDPGLDQQITYQKAQVAAAHEKMTLAYAELDKLATDHPEVVKQAQA